MAAPLQFVVLRHSGISVPHFDLMVETLPGSGLATWRSPVWPIDTATVLTRLKDHRRFFLEYEGDLSEHRGRVDRIDGGTCKLDIGENSVWTLTTPRDHLQLRLQNGDQWEAIPK